ncbi:MAG: hypothetical protein H6710_21895 [Myxococcales bacterium]|nr:hypothetical protein [Myxococcales bacterium]
MLARASPERRDAPQLRAHARVQETSPGRFTLALEITTRDGVSARAIEAASCVELADATALLIAMMIDPAAAIDAEPPPLPPPPPPPPTDVLEETEPSLPPTTEAPPTEHAPEEAAPHPPPERPLRPRAAIGADLALGGAGLRASAPASASASPSSAPTSAASSSAAPTSRGRARAPGLEEGGAAVRYQLAGGGVRGCGVGRVGARARVELFGCLGVELGAMRGEGIDLPVSASRTLLWAAALVTPGLAVALAPRLALVARADLGVALARPRFAVLNYGDVYRAPPLSYVVSLGIELRLPSAPIRGAAKKVGRIPRAAGNPRRSAPFDERARPRRQPDLHRQRSPL